VTEAAALLDMPVPFDVAPFDKPPNGLTVMERKKLACAVLFNSCMALTFMGWFNIMDYKP
jgi:hypothetical protein